MIIVLTRNIDERIDITLPDGTVIEVVLVEIRTAHSAKIGIQAPDNAVIDRREVTLEKNMGN